MHALTTARLELPPWRDSFGEGLARLAADERVVRYVGDGQTWSAEHARERHQACPRHWEEHGFGWRAILDGPGGRFLGVAALSYLGALVPGIAESAIEAGWWLDPRAWARAWPPRPPRRSATRPSAPCGPSASWPGSSRPTTPPRGWPPGWGCGCTGTWPAGSGSRSASTSWTARAADPGRDRSPERGQQHQLARANQLVPVAVINAEVTRRVRVASTRPPGHRRAVSPSARPRSGPPPVTPPACEWRGATPLHSQSIAHPGACRKAPVMAHNRRPGQNRRKRERPQTGADVRELADCQRV